MLTRRISAVVAFLLALCLGGAVSALATDARIVRLSLAEGNVQMDRNIGQGIEPAILNTPITSGVRLETMQDGRAEVEFENGSTMRLAGPASVIFQELSMTDNGDKVTLVAVNHGTVYFDVHHKGDDDFRISMLGRTVTLAKTARLRVEVGALQSTVAVFKGEVKLAGYDEKATVKKNETLTLEDTDSSRYILAKGIAASEFDDWDRSREEYFDQYANASGYQYANSAYGAPYSYGMTDMLRYGSYYNYPGYGWMWRPYMYDASWDPFLNGAWSYYPGYGYIFVSTYPWGWTPYRYGRWVYVGGYGWCWSPSRSYRTWNVIPVVVHPPRGFVPLHRPDPRPGPVLFVDNNHRPTPHRPDVDRHDGPGGRRVDADDAPHRSGDRGGVSGTGVNTGGRTPSRDRDNDRGDRNANNDDVRRRNPAPANGAITQPVPTGKVVVDRRSDDVQRRAPDPATGVVSQPAPTGNVMERRGNDVVDRRANDAPRRVDPGPSTEPRFRPAPQSAPARQESPAPVRQPAPQVQHERPAPAPPVREAAPSRPAPAAAPSPSVQHDSAPRSNGFSGEGRSEAPAAHSSPRGGGVRR